MTGPRGLGAGTGAKRREGYGRGTHSIRGGAIAAATPEELAEQVLARFAAPGYEPPLLPAVALQLLEISRKSSTTFRDVMGLLEQEPLLTGRVVQLAKSAAYATREPVKNLEQAVSRLGLRTLTDLFLQVSASARVFRAPGFEPVMERVRRHSIVTAYLSRELTLAIGSDDDEAFLAGLLHDAGIAAMLILAAELCNRRAPPDLSSVWSAIFGAHVHAVGVLATAWKLSEELTITLRRHHDPIPGGKLHRRAAVVCVADWLASEVAPMDEVSEETAAEVRRALGISEPDVERMRSLAQRIAESLAA